MAVQFLYTSCMLGGYFLVVAWVLEYTNEHTPERYTNRINNLTKVSYYGIGVSSILLVISAICAVWGL